MNDNMFHVFTPIIGQNIQYTLSRGMFHVSVPLFPKIPFLQYHLNDGVAVSIGTRRVKWCIAAILPLAGEQVSRRELRAFVC